MIQNLVITDVTQMRTGDRVCVVGINQHDQSVRLIWDEKGVPKEHLSDNTGIIIYPKAKICLTSHSIDITPPHIEDVGYDPDSIKSTGVCSTKEWESILKSGSYSTVNEIFGGFVEEGKWVKPGTITKSIGTLVNPRLLAITLTDNSVKPRLTFLDTTGSEFNFAVSELMLWDLCYSKVKHEKQGRQELAEELLSSLKTSKLLYFRLGLARPWPNPNTGIVGCWIQVTGVYSFPDYLQAI